MAYPTDPVAPTLPESWSLVIQYETTAYGSQCFGMLRQHGQDKVRLWVVGDAGMNPPAEIRLQKLAMRWIEDYETARGGRL